MRVLFVVAFLIFTSCQKELSVNLPEHQSKLVCNSFFTHDSVFLFLTKSQLIYDKLNQTNISRATITLKSENQIIDTIRYSEEGYYKSGTKLSENTEYTLEINSDGFNQISSSDYLPSLVRIDSLIFYPKVGMDEEGYAYSELALIFTDPVEKTNYYELCIFNLNNSGNILPNVIWSDDLIIMNEGNNDFNYNNIVFADNMINGRKYTLRCKIWYNDYDIEYYFHFRSISENYYRYKKSLMRHFANQEGDIWSGTGNPVELYSNIKDGYGIFAGYQSAIDTIYVQK